MTERPLVIGKGTRQKRGNGVWRYRHNLGKDPLTGKYRYSPWRTIHTKKISEVNAALEAYKAELNGEGCLPTKNDLGLVRYSESFHKNRKGTIKQSTYEREEYEIGNISRLFGKIKVRQLIPSMIEDAYSQAREREILSESEIFKTHQKLKQVLDHAVADGIISSNPAKKVKVSKPRSAERQALSADEASRLRTILLSSKKDAHITAVLLMLETGMRRGEALGLTWENTDLAGGFVHIRQQNTSSNEKETPKSRASRRKIAISDGLIGYLAEWKSEQKNRLEKIRVSQTPCTPLVHCVKRPSLDKHFAIGFMNPDDFARWFRDFCVENGFGSYEGIRRVRYVQRVVEGEIIRKAYDEESWDELQRQMANDPGLRAREQIYVYKTERKPYGYKGLYSHMLRHTHATLLIGANTDIKTVQSRLGHSSISLTLDIYSHAIGANDAKAAADFDKMLDNS